MKLVEDSEREIEEIVPDEGELPMPSTKQMGVLSNWVHAAQGILKCCRVIHMDPEEPENPPDDYDVDIVKKQIEAADPFDPRLKPLTSDS